jgi:hypothetical protein
MPSKLQLIGSELAEVEADDLPDYYVENDYHTKASSFSKNDRELFFIGRTGSGKSAILEMIRRKPKGDSARVIDLTGEDFAFEFLLLSSEIKQISSQNRNIVFKALWKYVIIINILKNIYGNNSQIWNMFLYETDNNSYEMFKEFDELSNDDKTFTEQIFSFLECIQKFSETKDLYKLLKIIENFEKKELGKHINTKRLYILVDDLDKDWNPETDNVGLIKSLFECIIPIGTKFHENVRFVVALRTDIFKQINFHQTEKIRPYVIHLHWYNQNLEKIIIKRLISHWQNFLGIKISEDLPLERAVKEKLVTEIASVFPDNIGNTKLKKVVNKKVELDLTYFIYRSMRRPRDIINFINLCITEANLQGTKYISEKNIVSAEKTYSRTRLEALVDEWQYLYPKLEDWIDNFASRKYSHITHDQLCDNFADEIKNSEVSIKDIVDILYEVGFLGYRSPEDQEIKFSFISRGAPGIDHEYFVHALFYSYLNERTEQLGKRLNNISDIQQYDSNNSEAKKEGEAEITEKQLRKNPIVEVSPVDTNSAIGLETKSLPSNLQIDSEHISDQRRKPQGFASSRRKKKKKKR